jgi:hypothetical protein
MAFPSSVVKRAASVLALSLVSFAASAADVSIVPSARTVTFDCDRIVIPDKSFLSVDVNRDAKKGVYVYRYTVHTSDPASPAVHGILFKDLAEKTRTSTLSKGVANSITIESAAAPGVVRYSLIGDVEAGLTDEQLASLAAQFGGDEERMLGADELGPGRVFLATADPDQVRRFATDTLGALLDDTAGQGDLLTTLRSFLDNGRSVRRAATALDVHENTIRYRLARVEELTGLAVVSDSQDQLSAQLAMLVVRLQGGLDA